MPIFTAAHTLCLEWVSEVRGTGKERFEMSSNQNRHQTICICTHSMRTILTAPSVLNWTEPNRTEPNRTESSWLNSSQRSRVNSFSLAFVFFRQGKTFSLILPAPHRLEWHKQIEKLLRQTLGRLRIYVFIICFEISQNTWSERPHKPSIDDHRSPLGEKGIAW